MSELYVMIGMPGTGKSTWRYKFLKNNPSFKVISSDDIIEDYAYTHNMTYNEVFNQNDLLKGLDSKMWFMAESYRSNKDSVIWDQTNLSTKKRRRINTFFSGYKIHYIDFFDVDKDVDFYYSIANTREGKSIPYKVIYSMYHSYDIPLKNEDKNITEIKVIPPRNGEYKE